MPRPRAFGVAFEVDRDIHFHVVQQRGDLAVRSLRHVDETVEAALEACAHVALVIGTERHADDLEAAAIVQLEQPRHQIGGGVAAEIRGQIGEPNLCIWPGRQAARQWRGLWNLVSRHSAGHIRAAALDRPTGQA